MDQFIKARFALSATAALATSRPRPSNIVPSHPEKNLKKVTAREGIACCQKALEILDDLRTRRRPLIDVSSNDRLHLRAR
jgi:hypothetical protein